MKINRETLFLFTALILNTLFASAYTLEQPTERMQEDLPTAVNATYKDLDSEYENSYQTDETFTAIEMLKIARRALQQRSTPNPACKNYLNVPIQCRYEPQYWAQREFQAFYVAYQIQGKWEFTTDCFNQTWTQLYFGKTLFEQQMESLSIDNFTAWQTLTNYWSENAKAVDTCTRMFNSTSAYYNSRWTEYANQTNPIAYLLLSFTNNAVSQILTMNQYFTQLSLCTKNYDRGCSAFYLGKILQTLTIFPMVQTPSSVARTRVVPENIIIVSSPRNQLKSPLTVSQACSESSETDSITASAAPSAQTYKLGAIQSEVKILAFSVSSAVCTTDDIEYSMSVESVPAGQTQTSFINFTPSTRVVAWQANGTNKVGVYNITITGRLATATPQTATTSFTLEVTQKYPWLTQLKQVQTVARYVLNSTNFVYGGNRTFCYNANTIQWQSITTAYQTWQTNRTYFGMFPVVLKLLQIPIQLSTSVQSCYWSYGEVQTITALYQYGIKSRDSLQFNLFFNSGLLLTSVKHIYFYYYGKKFSRVKSTQDFANEIGQMIFYTLYPYEVRLNDQIAKGNRYIDDYSWINLKN